MPKNKAPEHSKEAEEFEAKIAALLQVDPKGIAGKHRKEGSDEG